MGFPLRILRSFLFLFCLSFSHFFFFFTWLNPFLPSTQQSASIFAILTLSFLVMFSLFSVSSSQMLPSSSPVHWCPGAICLYLSSPAIKIGQVWSRSDTCGGGRFKARFLMDFSRHGPTIYTAPADGVSVLGDGVV
jgi:hypothetical protein